MLHPGPATRPRAFASILKATTAAALSGWLTAVAAPSAADAAAQLGPLVQITRADPFAGCTADRVGRQPGTNYPNTEIEPWAAANPANPRNLLVGHQQDRWSNGGARGLVADVSRDGGATWRENAPPRVTQCTGNPLYQRSSDPWVTFSPNGVAYFMHLVTNLNPDGSDGPNGMLVSRSTDGGRSWGRPITLIRDTRETLFNDKNSITADPKRPRLVYAVWDRLQGALAEREEEGGGELPFGDAAPATSGAVDGTELARAHLRAARAGKSILFDKARLAARRAQRGAAAAEELPPKGPTLISRTTDGGRTWEPAQVLYDPGVNEQTIGNVILVLPNGELVNIFNHITYATVTQEIQLVRSRDRGRTWDRRPTTITAIINSQGTGTITPNKQQPVRDANILFHAAVDPRNGNLYVVWQDVRLDGIQQVLLATSTDGGRNWELSGPMNQTPPSFVRLREQAFVPAVEVGPRGEVVITYYDFRNDRNRGELTDHWAVYCEPSRNDCLFPDSYTEVRLTNRSFDMLNAPIARGRFLGDYMGLVRAGNAVHSVFGVADGLNRTSLVTRKLTFGGPGRDEVATSQP